MKTKYLITFSLFIFYFSAVSYGQLIVKDQEAPRNTLLQVNDEGTSGSITFPLLSSINSSTLYKLYNLNGNLYWGNTALGTLSTAGGWTDAGSIVRLTTSADKVGIGTPNPLSKLSVGGDGLSNATIYGKSASGFAGYFEGRTEIYHNSGPTSPQLLLYEDDTDFSRLTFQNSSGSNYWTIAARNSSTPSNEAFNIYNDVKGNVMSINGEGNIDIYSGELNRSGKTSNANLVPIAYGIIEFTGSIISGTGNFTATYNSSLKEYFITINNEYYDNTNYCTLTNSFVNLFCSYSRASSDGKLTVQIIDRTGSSLNQGRFYFVVYKP